MYHKILFPVDITEESAFKPALPKLLELLKHFGPELHLLYVVPDLGTSILGRYFPEDVRDKIRADARHGLERFAQEHLSAATKVHSIVAEGPVYQCVIDTAKKMKADLIIMTAHRPELKDYLLGPNAAKVVRHAETSVLVVRGE